MTNDYQIKCPNCGEPLDDTNRVYTTMCNAFKGMPGGESYIYQYRCRACGATITWTQHADKPTVSIKLANDEED